MFSFQSRNHYFIFCHFPPCNAELYLLSFPHIYLIESKNVTIMFLWRQSGFSYQFLKSLGCEIKLALANFLKFAPLLMHSISRDARLWFPMAFFPESSSYVLPLTKFTQTTKFVCNFQLLGQTNMVMDRYNLIL